MSALTFDAVWYQDCCPQGYVVRWLGKINGQRFGAQVVVPFRLVDERVNHASRLELIQDPRSSFHYAHAKTLAGPEIQRMIEEFKRTGRTFP